MAAALTLEQAKKVVQLINEQAEGIEFGKVFLEINLANGRMTNVQAETKKSVNLDH